MPIFNRLPDDFPPTPMNEKNAQLAQFLSDQYELGPDYKEGKTEFFNASREWSCATGLPPLSLNDVAFYMKKQSFAELRTKSKRYWSGLRLRELSRTEPLESTDEDSMVEKLTEELSSVDVMENPSASGEMSVVSEFSACEFLLLRNMGVDQITKWR